MKQHNIRLSIQLTIGWLLAYLLLWLFMSACRAADYYVAINGADVGDCSSGQPARTLGYATRVAIANDPSGDIDVIHIGVGIWNESISITSHTNQLYYSGAGSGVTIWNGGSDSAGVLIANAGTDIVLRRLTLKGTNNPYQSCIFAQTGAVVELLDDIVFSYATASHIHGESGSKILIWNDYTITGGAQSHVSIIGNVHVGFGGIVGTIQNGPTIPYFLVAVDCSSIVLGGTTWRGPLDGSLFGYLVQGNSVINTYGRGPWIIPGAPGISGTGGMCY